MTVTVNGYGHAPEGSSDFRSRGRLLRTCALRTDVVGPPAVPWAFRGNQVSGLRDRGRDRAARPEPEPEPGPMMDVRSHP